MFLRMYQTSKTIVKQAFLAWRRDRCLELGAALSFYAVLAIPPLLFLGINLLQPILSAETVQTAMLREVVLFGNQQIANVVEGLIEHITNIEYGNVGMFMAIIVAFAGATGVFVHLQNAINRIWKVDTSKKIPTIHAIVNRILAFAMVGLIGLTVFISGLLEYGLAYAQAMVGDQFFLSFELFQTLTTGVSLIVFTVLFSLMFKYLPDARVRTADVWVGGLLTAVLFLIGKQLVGIIVERSFVTSAYGSANTMIIIMLWVYFLSQIIFYGAEFTHVFAQVQGTNIKSGRFKKSKLLFWR